MTTQYEFDHHVARHVAGGLDETGQQFYHIIIVRVTGVYDEIDNRRWIAEEKIVKTATIICGCESDAIVCGLQMLAEVYDL